MSEELQSWLRLAPMRLKRELASVVKAQADRLAEAIKAQVPKRTGALRDSIRVRRTRKELKFVVVAGGVTTKRELRRNVRYEREVDIGSGDTQGIGRGDAGGVTYDYARAVEFGTVNMQAQPFFYSVARAMEADIRRQLEKGIADVITK